MSNYTCGPGPVTGPSLVSWPEAFGGLVPFALIAMGSPSRRVCDAPSAIGPWMRVSPIICLFGYAQHLSPSIQVQLPTRTRRSYPETHGPTLRLRIRSLRFLTDRSAHVYLPSSDVRFLDLVYDQTVYLRRDDIDQALGCGVPGVVSHHRRPGLRLSNMPPPAMATSTIAARWR